MHLGASKKDYYLGCLISYGILAFCISLVNTVIHRLIDPIYPAQTVINMMDVCQWTENGMIFTTMSSDEFKKAKNNPSRLREGFSNSNTIQEI